MKIFSMVEGVEVVYIQKEDIEFLLNQNNYVPLFIFNEEIKNYYFNPAEDDKLEFVCYKGKEKVDYFKKIEWLIDYREYSILSDSELITEFKILSSKLKKLSKDYIKISVEDIEKNQFYIKKKCDEYKYIQQSIVYIYNERREKIRINFPESILLSCKSIESNIINNDEDIIKKNRIKKISLLGTLFKK